MNLLTLVCVLLFLTVVSGRHFEDRNQHERLSDIEDENDAFTRHREHSAEPARHRRRRWQMGYGYDYPPPPRGFYSESRDVERNQDLTKIIQLLEEISSNLRRPQPPPPPPQPIYIPYPVPYLLPQLSSCSDKRAKLPNVTSRFPEMEDTNQNWGFVIPKDEDDDEEDDSVRPISFDPIKPKRPMKRPTPKVEHGSTQAEVSTSAPNLNEASEFKVPSMCTAAILSCCADNNRRQCFSNFGCAATYDSGDICSSESIESALESFKTAYSPVQ